jgi:hypothetical protein
MDKSDHQTLNQSSIGKIVRTRGRLPLSHLREGREKGAMAEPSARPVPIISFLRLRGFETLPDALSPSQLRSPSQGVQLLLLLSQSPRFLCLPCFLTNENAWTVESIKGDARIENMLSNYISSSQIVTIS